MNYIFTPILIMLSFFIFAFVAEAQIFKKLKQKSQKKLEGKVEQKVDAEMEKAAERMVEDSWNTILGEMAEWGGQADLLL